MILQGKTAVITGGSRGIGRAISQKFAENGANVALIYGGREAAARETLETLRTCAVRAQTYKCDMSDADQVKRAFDDIVRDFGTVDILVNNAGVTNDKLVLSMNASDFDDVISINLCGAFYAIRQIYSLFMRKKSGKIINISSVSGLMGNTGQANYAASKAGLIGLTKSVAKELASRGICCNAIAPGFVRTDMTAAFSDNDTVIHTIPMKRIGRPEEVAELALFLASPVSDYITGEVIRIDGGMAM
jgi:3-oxoacyl-[acyl-carrier protein] reductase